MPGGVVLVQCNIVSNDYQQEIRVLYTFTPNKSFGQLLINFSKKTFLKTFNSEFSYIEREIEQKINIILVKIKV